MTSEDVRSELERRTFRPVRLHLVSGATIDVPRPGLVSMLQNAVMILHIPPRTGYDVVAMRNIERLEVLRETE
jgi:hypothetical protein